MKVAITKPGQRQRAFTLVELLVVIAIIGILVSILLPAVGVVRDSARRTQNLNNLRSIGQALNAYEEAKKSYPPAVSVSRPQTGEPATIDDTKKELTNRSYSTSWAFELLPYIEQGNMYNKRHRTVTCNMQPVAFASPVQIYANPRRRDTDTSAPLFGGGVGTSLDYAANGGYIKVVPPRPHPDDPFMLDEMRLSDNDDIYSSLDNGPRGTKLPPPHLAFDPKVCGPFSMDWNVRISSAVVRDGTTQTIAIGDRHIPFDPQPPIDILKLDAGGLAGSSVYTVIRYFNRDPATSTALSHDPKDRSFYKFGTHIGDLVAFVYLDGHAEYLPTSTDPSVLRRLSTIADGQVISDL